MERGSTFFLRGVVIFMALVALAICIFVLPRAVVAEVTGDFDYLPILVGLYVAVIPFFIALLRAYRLLGYIDGGKAFSQLSVSALKHIKYCAFAICACFAAGMPYVFYLADRDDAPGIAAVGFVIVGASCVIATFAGVAQKLFQTAVDIKSENDLTV